MRCVNLQGTNYMQKEQFFNAKVLFLYGAKI